MVVDHEIDFDRNTSDVNLNEKENKIKNSEITIEKIQNPAKEIENDKEENILKENSNFEEYNNAFDLLDHEEICKTPNNKSKLNKTDQELCASPKTSRSTRKSHPSKSSSSSSSSESDAGISFNLKTDIKLKPKAKKPDDKKIIEQKKTKTQLLVKEEKMDVEDDVIVIDDSDEDVVKKVKKKAPSSASKSSDKGRKNTAVASIVDDELDSEDLSTMSFSMTNFRKTKIEAQSQKHKKTSKVVKSSSESESEKEKENLTQKKRRMTRRNWDDKEIVYLVYGVESLGKGSWVDILTMFKNKFRGRTNIDLKDKYRNLEKNQSGLDYYKKQARLLKDKIKSQVEKKGKNDDKGDGSSSSSD